MKASLNSPLIVKMSITFAVLILGTHFLHIWQVDRNASIFLKMARAEVEGENYSDAVKFYQSYLKLVPLDADAQSELGILFADLGSNMRAYSILESVLRSCIGSA